MEDLIRKEEAQKMAKDLNDKYYNLKIKKHGRHTSVHMTGKHYMLGKHLSKETKIKIGLKSLGRIVSDKTRKKMSLVKSGKNHPLFGKHLSEETKRKLRNAAYLRDVTYLNGSLKKVMPIIVNDTLTELRTQIENIVKTKQVTEKMVRKSIKKLLPKLVIAKYKELQKPQEKPEDMNGQQQIQGI
jgi:hypothetical protein